MQVHRQLPIEQRWSEFLPECNDDDRIGVHLVELLDDERIVGIRRLEAWDPGFFGSGTDWRGRGVASSARRTIGLRDHELHIVRPRELLKRWKAEGAAAHEYEFHASIPWGVPGGRLQLLDRLAVPYPLHGRHPVDDQDSIEMVIFVLDNPREPFIRGFDG